MKNIEIFEPAMCCSTGLCGVSVDPELLRISTVLNTLKERGIEVKRYNLTNAPMEFVKNKVVSEFVKVYGADRLPVTVVDGELAISGRYPTNEEFTEWLSLPQDLLGKQECCCDGGVLLMEPFALSKLHLTQYLFFTGKGGVGKTSTACAVATSLADSGNRVLLVSTDPASNLQDVFAMELYSKPTPITEVPGLSAANLDPIEAAAEYRESVIAPYRGILPDAAIANMEEQLSGSCTIEIAAFNAFANFITDESIQKSYDHIIFDTAPTGHTLRMLQLPSAWSNFINESTHGASCLGQLSGLEEKKAVYKTAVDTLADSSKTMLLLVTRPETAPLQEANRASCELRELGIQNQLLIVNGVLMQHNDVLSSELY